MVTLDDFNAPDMEVIDQAGGLATMANSRGGVPNNRWLSHKALSGPNDLAGTGCKVKIASLSFPVGRLEVANALGRDSEVKVGWTLDAGLVPTTAFAPATWVVLRLRPLRPALERRPAEPGRLFLWTQTFRVGRATSRRTGPTSARRRRR